MKFVEKSILVKNEKLTEMMYEFIILSPKIANEACAGQFVNLFTGHGEYILPRPISICEIDKEKGTLRLIFQVVGKGTEIFSQMIEGTEIKIVGPLGNGFSIPDETVKNHIVVGGGIGIAPLIELVKNLKGNIQVYIGAKTSPILVNEFKALGAEVFVSTDDGSEGYHGNVIELLRKINPNVDKVYSCGPKIMLKNLSDWAKEKGISAQVSMEERMACGIGACVGCAIKIKKADSTDWQNLKVCKDGPVFLSDEVVWNE